MRRMSNDKRLRQLCLLRHPLSAAACTSDAAVKCLQGKGVEIPAMRINQINRQSVFCGKRQRSLSSGSPPPFTPAQKTKNINKHNNNNETATKEVHVCTFPQHGRRGKTETRTADVPGICSEKSNHLPRQCRRRLPPLPSPSCLLLPPASPRPDRGSAASPAAAGGTCPGLCGLPLGST